MGDPETLCLNQLPGNIPPDCIPANCDVSECSSFVEGVLANPTPGAFTEQALWRDWMIFSDRVRTRAGAEVIVGVWQALSGTTKPHSFAAMPASVSKFIPTSSWVEVPFTFEATHLGFPVKCSGSASLMPDGRSSWKIWCLSTVLEGFEGEKSPDAWSADSAFAGHLSGGIYGQPTTNKANGGAAQSGDNTERYEVVIVGGGQAGMCTAARLAALGISYVVIEKGDQVGFSWKNRYDSIKLHTVKDMNKLPFDKTYEESDAIHMSGKDVARCYENYAQKFHLNMRCSSRVTSCRRDEKEQEWELRTETESLGAKTIRCKHIVLSVGFPAARPRIPKIPDQELFSGQVVHSTKWKNSSSLSGKRGVVIGSATNAYDVCLDMLEGGCSSVTMIQRSPTIVCSVESTQKFEQMIYNDQVPIDVADRITAKPLKITCTLQDENIRLHVEQDAKKYDALERAGFKVVRSGGIYDSIVKSAGGYYIDVGGCDRVIAGEVKVKSGVPISKFTSTGLAFADGETIPADVVVYATGYESDFRGLAAEVVGEDVASKLGPWWGLDVEGELRGCVKQDYPGLWRIGSSNAIVRFASRFIALRVQAEMMLRDKDHAHSASKQQSA